MTEPAQSAYYVGLRGPIDVQDIPEVRRIWVEGEIIRLLQVSETTLYAFIKTPLGTGLYQL